MSDVDYVIGETAKLEDRLRDELGANGRGLTALFNNVRHYFPDPETAEEHLETITDVRNRMVHHGDGKYLDDPRTFGQAVRAFNRNISDAENVFNSTSLFPSCNAVIVFFLAWGFAVGATLVVMI